MKRIGPIILTLFLLCSCAGKTVTSPTPGSSLTTTPQQVTPGQTAAPSPSLSPTPSENTVPPTQKLPPDWHYDLTKDGIFRTDRNTGAVVKINSSDDPTGIILTEAWVYYCDDDGHLFRMDNDSRKELLVGEVSRPLRLSGDVLYYLSSGGVHRMNLDGSGKERIFDGDYTGIEVTENYIFYTLETPESKEINNSPGAEDGPWFMGELHRAGLDCEGDVKIADMITELSVYENTVYFSDGEDTLFYSLNPQTLEKTKTTSVIMADNVYFSNDYIFFLTHMDRCYYRMSLIDGALTKLAISRPHCLGILDGYIYIDIDDINVDGIGPDETGLYRLKIDGVDLERVE